MRSGWVFLTFALFGASAFADDPSCPNCTNEKIRHTSNGTVMNWMADVIDPLEEEYFDPNEFEQDETGTQIALTSTEVKPPKKRKILAYKVRAGTLGKTHTIPTLSGGFADVTGFQNTVFPDGTMYLLNIAGTKANYVNGTMVPSASLVQFSDFQGKTFEESLTKMREILPQPYTEDQLRLSAAYLNFVSSKDEAQIKQTMNQLSKNLSTDEKIKMMLMIGGESSRRYDSKLAAQGYKLNFDPMKPYSVLLNLKNPAKEKYDLGVCRWIALDQTRALADGFGFKNVYSISYNAGVPHVAVMMQDPDHPKQVLLMSYDEMEKRNTGSGLGALSFNQDYSQSYMIQDAQGKTVANFPSEMSQLIKEGGGANIRRIDPMLFRANGSVASLSYEGEKSKYAIFTGETAKDHIVGIAQTFRAGNEEGNFYFTSTTALARQTRHMPLYTNKSVTGEGYSLSTIVSTDVNTPSFTVSKNNTGKIEVRGVTRTTLNADVTVAGEVGGIDGKSVGMTPTLNTEVGVEIKKTGATEENANWKVRAASQYGLGTNDISAMRPNRIYHNVSYVTASGENIQLPNGLKGSFDAAVALREFGPEVFTQMKVTDPQKKISVSGGYQGGFSPFNFSKKETFLDFEKELNNGMKVNATYIQPIAGSPQFQAGVKGTIPSSKKKSRKPAVTAW